MTYQSLEKTFSEENQLYSLLKILYNSPLENKDVLDFSSSVKKNIINIKKNFRT